MPDKFLFDQEGVDQIRKVVRRVLGESKNQAAGGASRSFFNFTALVGLLNAAGATAGSTSVPGSGAATIYRFTSGTLSAVMDSNGDPVTATVRNLHEAIPGNRFVNLDQDRFGVFWIVSPFHSPGHIRIKNDSGSDLAQYAVLGLDGIIAGFTPDEGVPYFSGITPAEPDHLGKFAVIQQALDDGASGVAAVAGITPVLVNENASVDADGWTFADVLGGETGHLGRKFMGSAKILHREPDGDDDEQWAWIRFSECHHATWLFQLNENMGATTADEADADLLTLDGTDTAIDVTVKDNLNSTFAAGLTGDLGLCVEHCGTYYVIQLECPE